MKLQREALVGGVQVAEADAAGVRARVMAGVGAAYAGVLAAEERLAARARLSELLREGVTVAQQLYNVGAADRPDLLEAEAEATRMALAMRRAELARDDAWMALAVAVGRPDLPRLPVGGSLRELPRLAERTSVSSGGRRRQSGSPIGSRARGRGRGAADARRIAKPRRTSSSAAGSLYNRELFERSAGGRSTRRRLGGQRRSRSPRAALESQPRRHGRGARGGGRCARRASPGRSSGSRRSSARSGRRARTPRRRRPSMPRRCCHASRRPTGCTWRATERWRRRTRRCSWPGAACSTPPRSTWTRSSEGWRQTVQLQSLLVAEE